MRADTPIATICCGQGSAVAARDVSGVHCRYGQVTAAAWYPSWVAEAAQWCSPFLRQQDGPVACACNNGKPQPAMLTTSRRLAMAIRMAKSNPTTSHQGVMPAGSRERVKVVSKIASGGKAAETHLRLQSQSKYNSNRFQASINRSQEKSCASRSSFSQYSAF